MDTAQAERAAGCLPCDARECHPAAGRREAHLPAAGRRGLLQPPAHRHRGGGESSAGAARRLAGRARYTKPGPAKLDFMAGFPTSYPAATTTSPATELGRRGCRPGAGRSEDRPVYTTPIEHHNPMEPHATIAQWDGDHLTAARRHPKHYRSAGIPGEDCLAYPKDNVHVITLVCRRRIRLQGTDLVARCAGGYGREAGQASREAGARPAANVRPRRRAPAGPISR